MTLNNITTLDNYALSRLNDYENTTSFPAFKLLELNTNSTLAGNPAYTLIGTYQDPSFGLQKLMDVGTIIGDKVYYVQYIASAFKYSDYLPAVQHMIDSMLITPRILNQSQINARLNGIVDFCMKSLPVGIKPCDNQLKNIVTQICARIGELDACHDGKVDQYYKVRASEGFKNTS
ncbi:MAG: hypothetical protein WBF33_20765 [Candidatus Nitrosopolaris sp.]